MCGNCFALKVMFKKPFGLIRKLFSSNLRSHLVAVIMHTGYCWPNVSSKIPSTCMSIISCYRLSPYQILVSHSPNSPHSQLVAGHLSACPAKRSMDCLQREHMYCFKEVQINKKKIRINNLSCLTAKEELKMLRGQCTILRYCKLIKKQFISIISAT